MHHALYIGDSPWRWPSELKLDSDDFRCGDIGDISAGRHRACEHGPGERRLIPSLCEIPSEASQVAVPDSGADNTELLAENARKHVFRYFVVGVDGSYADACAP
jgi:hypothetical protein